MLLMNCNLNFLPIDIVEGAANFFCHFPPWNINFFNVYFLM
jgi:hypothetical protein